MIVAEYVGVDRAVVNGVTYKSQDGVGVAPYVCRKLLEGQEDELIVFVRNGTECFEPMLMSKWAGLQYRDKDAGLKVGKYNTYRGGDS
jgi:hypothetical protein